jgi:hypothetical protein
VLDEMIDSGLVTLEASNIHYRTKTGRKVTGRHNRSCVMQLGGDGANFLPRSSEPLMKVPSSSRPWKSKAYRAEKLPTSTPRMQLVHAMTFTEAHLKPTDIFTDEAALFPQRVQGRDRDCRQFHGRAPLRSGE